MSEPTDFKSGKIDNTFIIKKREDMNFKEAMNHTFPSNYTKAEIATCLNCKKKFKKKRYHYNHCSVECYKERQNIKSEASK